jgi:hypothetical protein
VVPPFKSVSTDLEQNAVVSSWELEITLPWLKAWRHFLFILFLEIKVNLKGNFEEE